MITYPLKNWLADNAGVNGCFVPSELTYQDPDGIERTGSTGDALNAFVVAHLVGKDDVIIIKNTNYTQLKVINEGNSISIDDVAFAYNNDGDPSGEPLYCSGACVVEWRCETPLNGYEFDGCGNRRTNMTCNPVDTGIPENAGEFVFVGPPEGLPTIVLNLSNLQMSQDSSDYHFEMDDIVITSTSPQRIYIALEVRLFAGALSTCPSIGAAFVGMDRVSTSKNVRIKVLDPGEENEINADFYQQETLRGIHTVCLLVHGAWTREELEAEIALIPG